MYALAMNENLFVLLEDPSAPTKADVLATLPPGGNMSAHMHAPTHYRTTFLTLRPPEALDQLLTQLRARWVPVRQTASTGAPRGQPTLLQGQQLAIDGHVFAIGDEWLVRVGNVILAGGAIKGMLLEVRLMYFLVSTCTHVLQAEYLPLPVLHSHSIDGTSEFLSNLLTSLLPNIRDAKTMAVTISDSQWEEVLWDREEEARAQAAAAATEKDEETDDIYFLGDREQTKQRGDWVGVDRDRRASFLIIGALKSEGIL